MFQQSLSLRAKVSLLLLFLLACGFWLLALVSARLLEHDMGKLLSAEQFSTASYIAGDIDEAVKSRLEILQGSAAQITPALLADREALEHVLQEESGEMAVFFRGGTLLLSPAGRLLLDWPEVPARRQLDFSQMPCFQEVLAKGAPIVAAPVTLLESGEPGVPFAAPVKDADGQLIAVLVGLATISDNAFFGVLERTHFGESGYALVKAAQHGLIVSSSKPELALQPISTVRGRLTREPLSEKFEGSQVVHNASGVGTLLSAKQIPSAGWTLLLALPTEEAFAPIRRLQRLGYLLTATFCGGLFFLAWFVLGRALRPLENATQAIEGMVVGKAPMHDLPVAGGNEIGRLLQSFNRLVAERQRVEADLLRSHKIFEAMEMAVTESIFLLDARCLIHMANLTAARRLGVSRDELFGRDFAAIFGDDGQESPCVTVRQVYETGQPLKREMTAGGRVYATTYYPVQDQSGDCLALLVLAVDVTEHKAVEAALVRQAQTDALTGLANRRHFMRQAELELARVTRYGGVLAVLMMDVDHFKSINDTHGHKAGDLVLQDLARRCREALREVDVIGRVGGEEFAILLPQTELAQAVEVAERLRCQIAESPTPLDDGILLPTTVSIGVAMLAGDEGCVDALLHQADQALYQAKRGGRNRVCVVLG